MRRKQPQSGNEGLDRVQGNQDERRATRAFNFVQMGELSSRRQALEGEELAPGNEETLKELRKRVAIPRDAVPLVPRDAPVFNRMREFLPQRVCSGRTMSDDDRSSSTPLGEHRDLHNLFKVAQLLAKGQIPREHCQHHQAREDDGTQEGWWRRAGDCCRRADS